MKNNLTGIIYKTKDKLGICTTQDYRDCVAEVLGEDIREFVMVEGLTDEKINKILTECPAIKDIRGSLLAILATSATFYMN